MKITLIGRIPSKKNSKIMSCRGSRPLLFPSAKHKEWHFDASRQLRIMDLKKIPTGTPIVFTLFAPDNRRADLSNKWESVGDLFVDNGIVEDDSWFELPDIHLKFGGVDKENPRAVIEY